jgi:hypothetical protein
MSGDDRAFVLLLIDRLLGKHQTRAGGEGRDHVQRAAATLPVVAAARGLAVDGDQLGRVGPEALRPIAKAGLKPVRIEAVHHRPQPIGARRPEVELGKAPQEGQMIASPQRDLVIILTIGDRRRDHQEQYLAQQVAYLGRLARIIDRGKMLQKRPKLRRPERRANLFMHDQSLQRDVISHESRQASAGNQNLNALT